MGVIVVPKYGRGLNREIVGGVNQGYLPESFSVADIKKFVAQKSWQVPETYVVVCLANSAATKHSHTYIKYFVSLGNGQYKLSENFTGGQWK